MQKNLDEEQNRILNEDHKKQATTIRTLSGQIVSEVKVTNYFAAGQLTCIKTLQHALSVLEV